jgi:hypothetical protein
MNMQRIFEDSNNDSSSETQKHIDEVIKNADNFISKLQSQVKKHDSSKLEDPEKPYFDDATPLLKKLKYGSDEYKKSLENIKPALDHHYANNSHHIFEYYKDGVLDANLIDLIEMLCDWVAAVKRNKEGNILESLEINKKRYNIEPQLYALLKNSIELFN